MFTPVTSNGISFDSIKEFAFDNSLIRLFCEIILGVLRSTPAPSKSDLLCLSLRGTCVAQRYLNRNLCTFAGAYFLSHSLSWSNNKENSGAYHKKVWIPEDPRSAKANGRYVNEV